MDVSPICPECGKDDFTIDRSGSTTIGAHRFAKHGIKSSTASRTTTRRSAGLEQRLADLAANPLPTMAATAEALADRETVLRVYPSPLPRRYCAWTLCQHHLSEHDLLRGKIYCSPQCRRKGQYLRDRNALLERRIHDVEAAAAAAKAELSDVQRLSARVIAALQADSLRYREIRKVHRALVLRHKRMKESLQEARQDATASKRAALRAIAELRALRNQFPTACDTNPPAQL